ncbi:hypothetical protein CYY_010229 [Polysphondylium violaceum]|uniref:Uncharacterized protein n=1 Tax=Polysphondylium violaceum TaxID=133409 RepID=A0A8J4UNW0_9MYCE|nr:hypothetical protein CYY_010229 [Polysphondylium violaceum]
MNLSPNVESYRLKLVSQSAHEIDFSKINRYASKKLQSPRRLQVVFLKWVYTPNLEYLSTNRLETNVPASVTELDIRDLDDYDLEFCHHISKIFMLHCIHLY